MSEIELQFQETTAQNQFGDSSATEWFLREASQLPRWAHHPSCGCYSNHLLWFGKRCVCLGCFAISTGIGTALCILSALWIAGIEWIWHPHLAWGIAIGIALYTPTLIQPFLQYKTTKLISRFLLGIGVVFLVYSAMFGLPWSITGIWLRAVFCVVFAGVYRFTQKYRIRFTPSPCERCPFGRFPFCAGNRERILSLLPELRIRATEGEQSFVRFVETWVNEQSLSTSFSSPGSK